MTKIVKRIASVFALIVLLVACTAHLPVHISVIQQNENTNVCKYTGDGKDLIYAREIATNKTCLITVFGEIVIEIPEDAYCLGMKMIFIPDIGVVNLKGELLFNPNCDWMYEYGVGLAPFGYMSEDGMRAGYFDTNGNIAIEPDFYSALPFSDGLAAVQFTGSSGVEGEWGYINTAGKIIYRGFTDAEPFSDGLALVSLDNERYGYINTKGEFVIEPIYASAFSFSEGLAAVSESETEHSSESGEQFDYVSRRLYGYIDTTGNYVIEPKYNFACDFENGVAAVTNNMFDYAKGYYLISQTGDVLLVGPFTSAYSVAEGVLAVNPVGEKDYCFMSYDGEVILTEFSPF